MTTSLRGLRRSATVCAAMVVLIGGAGSISARTSRPAGTESLPPAVLVPVTPFRVLDTRLGIGTGGRTDPVGAEATIDVQIAGVGVVPADALGVVINLTATAASATTYITAWPSGNARPTAGIDPETSRTSCPDRPGGPVGPAGPCANVATGGVTATCSPGKRPLGAAVLSHGLGMGIYTSAPNVGSDGWFLVMQRLAGGTNAISFDLELICAFVS